MMRCADSDLAKPAGAARSGYSLIHTKQILDRYDRPTN